MAETLLTFPCDFTIKVFGAASSEFEAAILRIVHQHVSAAECKMESRLSENGKYNSLSITMHVTSKKQLDQIYTDLSASPLVLMTL